MEKTNLTFTQTVAHLLVFIIGVCVIVPIYWLVYIVVGLFILAVQILSFVLQFFTTTTDIVLYGYKLTKDSMVERNKNVK